MKARLIALALLCGPTAAIAQHGDWCACGEQSSLPARFEIDHGSEPWISQARASFDRWNLYANLFSYTQGDGRAGVNGKNEIIFFSPETTGEVHGILIDEFTFAVAPVYPEAAFGDFNVCPAPAGTTCGVFNETDVIMNRDFIDGWTDALPTLSATGPAYYLTTAIHEIGHTIGLHHDFDSLTTMNYMEDFAGQYLSLSDTNAARALGPPRQLVDLAIYPFRWDARFTQSDGTVIASLDRSTAAVGETFQLRDFTLENVGSETVNGVRLRVYLSTDPIITADDYLTGELRWDNFSTWWDTEGEVPNFVVASNIPSGTYYVGAIVTYNDSQLDSVAYNNTWVLDDTRRLTVTGGGSGATNYTQVWFDASRSGQGVQLLQTGNTISGAWYLYDEFGEDVWVTFVGQLNGATVTADLLSFTGPALGTEWDPSLVRSRPVGSVTIDFTSPIAANFNYTVNGVSDRLVLQVFDPLATGPYSKVWFDPSRAGQGVQILQSGNTISGAWYLYDESETATWRTFVGTLNGNTVNAALLNYSGPALGDAWDNGQVRFDSDGVVTINFASPDAATFDYTVDGVSGSLSLVPFIQQ